MARPDWPDPIGPSGLPCTGDLGFMFHKPIRFQIPLKILKTLHGLRAMPVYVEIGADPSRLPPFPSLAPAVLGLCSVVVQFSYVGTAVDISL